VLSSSAAGQNQCSPRRIPVVQRASKKEDSSQTGYRSLLKQISILSDTISLRSK
jgi:hypothetical protein